jgi:hypothetical protein
LKPFSEMINDNKTNVSQEATDENEQLPFDEVGQDRKECEAPVLSPDVSSKLMKLVRSQSPSGNSFKSDSFLAPQACAESWHVEWPMKCAELQAHS